uniref:Si:ch211-241j12.3 n=3 Tax=Salmo trutta TaxID=8032 RepID=A0A674E6Q5_SALTR
MSRRHAKEFQGSSPSPPLPPDHVLNSGAVVFPGAFDQHGYPLVMFPVDAHGNLSDLSKAEVVGFIHYFLCLHNKKQEESLVSVVADLRQATLTTTRFIAETLLLLELHRRTVYTVYMIKPKKKDVLKLLLKQLVPSKSYVAPFKRVLLKEVFELSNYIDRSQLTAALGGYLVYCHLSCVTFIREIDAFVQEFLSVVQRLPSCISTLQTLSRQPVPSAFTELNDFCHSSEAKFRLLRRELGLDELLRHCERVVEKLHYPENDSCYQAMAGTVLFTHTAFNILQNYSRITAAAEKIELLWQQAFSKAHLQVQVFQLRDEAQQITEQIKSYQKEKLQPYRIEIAKDARKAETLTSEFEASIYKPAMALVHRAEDVIHTLADTLPPGDAQTREEWVQDLDRLKENFHSAVELPRQTLGAVADFYHYYNKANCWYSIVLCENFLQDLLWGVNCDSFPKRYHPLEMHGPDPVWRQAVCDFLRRNPSPDMEELVQLAQLANVIPDAQLQQKGKQLSQRCMTLQKLLTSPGAVPISNFQLALQWQYEFLRARHRKGPGPHTNLAVGGSPEAINSPDGALCSLHKTSGSRSDRHTDNLHSRGSLSNLKHQVLLSTSPSSAISGAVSAVGKPPSLSSFDSGFDGAGSSHVETGAGREGWEGLSRVPATRDSFRPITRQPQIHEENISSVSDSEDCREEFDFGSVGNTSRASIQIIPKITVDSLHFQIKLKQSATLPQNPWLSLPVDDLENSYTVTITQNPSPHQRDIKSPNPSECSHHTGQLSNRSRDQPTQTEVHTSPQNRGAQPSDSILQAQDSFEESERSPVCNSLSSTITDAGDVPNFTAESIPTLLWDTSDFHNPKQDTCERITSSMTEVSLNDWDLKEQEGLREVAEILDRAAGILEVEENVMAQEQMLDVLLNTGSTSKLWPSWGSEEQKSLMSSSDLKAAGVLGLDDSLDSADTDNHSECRSSEAASETEASECSMSHNGRPMENGPTGLRPPQTNRGQFLKELKGLHVLDELIMEENLKIHKLRQAENESLDEKPTQLAGSRITCKERQAFLFELEREKREVERMEKNLAKEMTKGCQLTKRMSRTRKVVKCSIMDRTSKLNNLEVGALCDDLISGHRGRHLNVKHLPTLPKDTINLVPNESLVITATFSAIMPISQDFVQSVNGQSPHAVSSISGCGDAVVEVDAPSHSEFTEPSAPQPVLTPPQSYSDPSEFIEDFGIQHQEGTDEEGLDFRLVSNLQFPQEATLTPEMCPKHGVFDPSWNYNNNPPVPKPRKASLPVNDRGQELNISTETMYLTLCPDSDSDPDPRLAPQVMPEFSTHPKPKERSLKPVKEHSNNHSNKPLTAQQASLCNNPLESHEQTSLDTSSVESTLTPVDSAGVQIEIHLSQKSEDISMAHSGSNSEQLPRMFAEVISGSCEPSGADEWREVESPDGFQRCRTARRAIIRSPVNQPNVQITTRDMTNFKTAIVLDTGSGLMKAGFADQDLPNTIFPNIIGLPKYEEIMNGNFERETFIGHEAQHMRGVLALKYPMKNGIISNWDEMEKIWHHTFQQLQVDPDDHPVLLTEAAMNPLENRQRMVELMFECFNVPLAYVAMQAVLALYAAGRSTGVVFDSGDGVSHSVPVFEGYCLPHAVQRFTLAGHDVTMHLKMLLQEQGVCMRTSAEMEIVREIKEKCCRVAQDYESELTCGRSASSEMYYTMPDGQVVHLSTERFSAPEILFKPDLIGRDHYGMHESIFKSILLSDIDLRRSFLGNIVLSGGNTLLAGLPERLQSEIRTMVPTDLMECVRVTSPKDRDFSVWSGGAVLANLSSFDSAWISQEEYEEHGPQIVFRKCF